MPIAIVEYPEPLTTASRTSRQPRMFIESDAYHQLVQELRRYCKDQIHGRSFLISGHRGSGKTTLVLNAFEQIERESWKDPVRFQRPLLVLLNGPSLLPKPDDQETQGGSDLVVNEMESVLIQITLGLHRAVAAHFSQAFREFIVQHGPSRKQELAAQLELELDEYAGNGRLREYWRRADAIACGILFRDLRVSDQGLRELVALGSVCEAHRRISGTLNRKEEIKAGAKQESKAELGFETRKEILPAIISLLTGGAAGAGVLAVPNSPPQLAIFTGFLVALLSALAARLSVSQSRQRSAAQEDLFVPDLSVATLDRVLPVLIRRLRHAGLAPIFVIDELDKVDSLTDRINAMVFRLKKLIAEEACFCFVTDRRYFEELRVRAAITPYSTEYTYFSNQLFVTFRHSDLHRYLREVLKPEGALSYTNTVELEKSKPSEQQSDAKPPSVEEFADLAVLPFILLHASQMHPIDLRRELTHLSGASGNIEPVGTIRTSSCFLLELRIQVAIELLLDDEDMNLELERQPAFRRLAYDGLYYISRCWERDEDELSLNNAAEQEFEKYLCERMVSEQPLKSETTSDLQNFGVQLLKRFYFWRAPTQVKESPLRISESDKTFLWHRVHKLADLLSTPGKILDEAKTQMSHRDDFPPIILDVLQAAESLDPLLSKKVGNDEVYTWLFRRSGRPLFEKFENTAVSVGKFGNWPWLTYINAIRTFEQKLQSLSASLIDPTTLSADLGVIRSAPAWPAVKRAMDSLDTNFGHAGYNEAVSDISTLRLYVDLVHASRETITLALFCGSCIGFHADLNPLDQAVFVGLKIISSTYKPPVTSEDRVLSYLRALADEIRKWLNVEVPNFSALSLDAATDVDTWAHSVSQSKDEVFRAMPRVLRQRLDEAKRQSPSSFWEKRLQNRDIEFDLDLLLCASHNEGPFRILSFNVEAMTARALSRALVLAVSREQKPEVPRWIAIAALQQLGLLAEPEVIKKELVSLFHDQEKGTEEFQITQRWSVGPLQSRQFRAIIVSKEEDSIAEKWKLSSQNAALILRETELDSIIKLGTDFVRTLSVDWIVFDLTSKTIPARRRRSARPLPEARPRTKKFVAFFENAKISTTGSSTIPLAIMVPANSPYRKLLEYKRIIDPSSLDDMFEQLR